jgi:hypothetical protein
MAEEQVKDEKEEATARKIDKGLLKKLSQEHAKANVSKRISRLLSVCDIKTDGALATFYEHGVHRTPWCYEHVGFKYRGLGAKSRVVIEKYLEQRGVPYQNPVKKFEEAENEQYEISRT